jgi:hypothetical protein
MSYTICIERDEPIALAEWSELIRSRADVRMLETDSSFRNPTTGEVISIGRVEGDAELLLEGTWVPCFRWQEDGAIAFNAPDDFDQPTSVVRRVALELTKGLRARLVGEAGEEYER